MSASLRRAGVLAICAALILVSAAMALYWLADAANIWLSSRMSANSAALVIGAVLLVPIAALLIVHWISSHVEARVAHEHAAHAQA